MPDVWAGVVSVFRDFGYRRLRHRARLKFLIADWGVEKFREVLEKDYLGRALPDGPAPELSADPGDGVGVHEQKDGRFYVGVAPTVGRVSGDAARRRSPTSSRPTARTGSGPRRTRSCSCSTSTPTRSSR